MPLRRALKLLLVAALASAVFATPAPAATTKVGGLHADAAEGAALDLAGASLGQHERDLVLTVRTHARIDPDQLSTAGGGELCTTFEPVSGAARRLCVTRSGGAWRLAVGPATVTGSVAHPSAGTLVVRIDPGVVGLQPGPLRWRVFARAVDCSPAAGASNGGATPDGDTAEPAPVAATPCGDRAPDAGSYPGRVWHAAVTGCTATGPAEVLSGPPGKRIALTYDDGPSSYTPHFLDELERLGVPATFFMIGRQVAANAGLVRRMLADGDMVGNHTWSHANLAGGGPGATAQLVSTQDAIRRASGFTPCLFRPPYRATGADLVARSRALGMTSVLWSVDPSDYALPGAGAIAQRVVSHTGPGAIIIEHDGGGSRAQTLAALPQIVAALRSRGYRFVTVTTLLGYRERVTLRP